MNRRYYIPENFASAGTVLGGIKIVNLVQTVIIDAPILFIIFKFTPFSLTTKVVLLIIFGGLATYFGLAGMKGRSLFKYALDVVNTKRTGKIYKEPDPSEAISREKQLVRKRYALEKQHQKEVAREVRKQKRDETYEKRTGKKRNQNEAEETGEDFFEE